MNSDIKCLSNKLGHDKLLEPFSEPSFPVDKSIVILVVMNPGNTGCEVGTHNPVHCRTQCIYTFTPGAIYSSLSTGRTHREHTQAQM